MRRPTQRTIRRIKVVLLLACTVPIAMLAVRAGTGALGSNPVETLTHTTGDWALRLVLAALLVTPLRRLTGWTWLVRLRRLIGVYGFVYAALHVTVYAVLEAQLRVAHLLEDLAERTYIAIGLAAFALLVPLAATSTNAMIRRLGAERWRRLHWLVYPATLAGAVHYVWLAKGAAPEPRIYLAVAVLLIVARVPFIARGLDTVGTTCRTRLASITKTGPR